MTGRPRTIWLVAGEDSGDQLGAKLMRALREAAPDTVFGGVGGEAMAEAGFASLFPLDDVAVMGYLPVLARARTRCSAASARRYRRRSAPGRTCW